MKFFIAVFLLSLFNYSIDAQTIQIEAEDGVLANGASIRSGTPTAIHVLTVGNIGTATYILDTASGFSENESSYQFKLYGTCAGNRPCNAPLIVTINNDTITNTTFQWEKDDNDWDTYTYSNTYTGNFIAGDSIILYINKTTDSSYPGNIEHLLFEFVEETTEIKPVENNTRSLIDKFNLRGQVIKNHDRYFQKKYNTRKKSNVTK